MPIFEEYGAFMYIISRMTKSHFHGISNILSPQLFYNRGNNSHEHGRRVHSA